MHTIHALCCFFVSFSLLPCPGLEQKAHPEILLVQAIHTHTRVVLYMHTHTHRWVMSALDTMAQPSAAAAKILAAHGARGCTDVSGFGLLGHLVEMTKPSGVSLVVGFEDGCLLLTFL